MRVLFSLCAPPGQTPGGGDQVQMHHTAMALKDLGVEVAIDNSPEPDPEGFEIVHLFNLQYQAGISPKLEYLAGRRAEGLSFKTVLSAIFWDQAELAWAAPAIEAIFTKMRQNPAQRELCLNELANRTLHVNHTPWYPLLPAGHPWSLAQRIAVASVDMVLVSGAAELLCLQHSLRWSSFPFAFVTNAVPKNWEALAPPDPQWGIGDEYVLFVGRWADVRKNLLMLSEALRQSPFPLVIVGPCGPAERELLVRTTLPEGTRILDSVPHEHLPTLYASARVFVLPSWYETPGLAALEAAAIGHATLVVGNRSAEAEYFRDGAYYCDPGDWRSIHDAVHAAWDRWPSDTAKRDRLRTRIRLEHTWPRAAAQTLVAYREVLHA